jgi:hypothetical protein
VTFIRTALGEDGLAGQVVLGMDAAHQGYDNVYGGSPGLGWLLVANPARAFGSGTIDGGDG